MQRKDGFMGCKSIRMYLLLIASFFILISCEDYEDELHERMRVTKPGGYIIDCPGEDDRKQPEGPKKEPLELGFQYLHYTSKLGGDVYRYWIQKPG